MFFFLVLMLPAICKLGNLIGQLIKITLPSLIVEFCIIIYALQRYIKDWAFFIWGSVLPSELSVLRGELVSAPEF